MGCYVSVLSKHNFNITNVESLAIDLAKRLNIRDSKKIQMNNEYDCKRTN